MFSWRVLNDNFENRLEIFVLPILPLFQNSVKIFDKHSFSYSINAVYIFTSDNKPVLNPIFGLLSMTSIRNTSNMLSLLLMFLVLIVVKIYRIVKSGSTV